MAGNVIRVAALGDLHCTRTSQGAFQPLFAKLAEAADVVLIAGDLTDYGLPEEARVLAKELTGIRVPIAAVLGNHDIESGKAEEVRRILTDAGVVILDGEVCEMHGIGIAGAKGFGGGFGKHALGPWGETIIKQFVREAIDEALKFEAALARLRTKHLVGLLHYSPVQQTVDGEPLEIYPFLGSSRLEEPISRYPVSLVVHGHAHRVLAPLARAARYQGHRRVRQAGRLSARTRGVRASRVSNGDSVPALAGEDPLRRSLHGRDLQLRQRRRARRRSLVRARAESQRARSDRAADAGRRNDLVEGVHPGARAVRRRRRPAPAARDRSVARLAAAVDAVRRLLARPAQPPHSVWLRVSRQTAEHPQLGERGADAAAERQPTESAERHLLRHAPFTRAVSARRRALEVSRRARAAVRSDDARAARSLDVGHQRQRLIGRAFQARLASKGA